MLFGVNIGADAEGNPSASFEEKPKEPEKPKMGMDDMDTAVPPEPKQQKKQEEEMIEDPIEDDKEEAKREKEMGNGFYKKKDFDNALKHYDNVSFYW